MRGVLPGEQVGDETVRELNKPSRVGVSRVPACGAAEVLVRPRGIKICECEATDLMEGVGNVLESKRALQIGLLQDRLRVVRLDDVGQEVPAAALELVAEGPDRAGSRDNPLERGLLHPCEQSLVLGQRFLSTGGETGGDESLELEHLGVDRKDPEGVVHGVSGLERGGVVVIKGQGSF